MSKSARKNQPERTVVMIHSAGDSESGVKVSPNETECSLTEENSDHENLNPIKASEKELAASPEPEPGEKPFDPGSTVAENDLNKLPGVDTSSEHKAQGKTGQKLFKRGHSNSGKLYFSISI